MITQLKQSRLRKHLKFLKLASLEMDDSIGGEV